MPLILIRKREDRMSMIVPVHCGIRGAEEKIEIKRGEPVEVTDAILEALKNSHEADYVTILSAPPQITKLNEEEKRRAGRPTNEERERMRLHGATS